MHLPPLGNLGPVLRRIAQSRVDPQPTWMAPHSWADADGLYASGSQSWLYRQLPTEVLADVHTLDRVLTSLAQALPGRQVHLLLHTWEHLLLPADQTPRALAAFQAESIRFLVPTQSVTVGVELHRDAGGTPTSAAGEVNSALDDLLGESTPDFVALEADRARVSQALTAVGATALTRELGAFVEAWYTLGAGGDIRATETDTYISLGGGTRMELATAGPLHGTLVDGQIPTVHERGTTVLSVRGTLSTAGGDQRTVERGVLMRASVIYGRRADSPTVPWTVELRVLGNMTPRPLPLRQLAAVDETLPCSSTRLAPTHQRVGAAELRALGMADPQSPGAESGLLVGTGGQTMSRAVYLNPLSGTGTCTIVGAPGAGKTFLSEVLATQSYLGGFGVTYLAGDPDAGRGFSALTGTTAWTPQDPGDLDPFRWLAPEAAVGAHLHVLDLLELSLSPDERSGLQTGFDRATRSPTTDLLSILRLADSVTAVARVRRELHRRPELALFVAPAHAGQGALAGGTRVDLSPLASSPSAMGVAAGTLLAHLAATAVAPHLIVLDAMDAALRSPHLVGALQQAAANPQVAVVVVARQPGALPVDLFAADHSFVLAGDDDELLRFAGLDVSPARKAWLAGGRAQLQPGFVTRSATGIYRAPGGAPTGVLLGPWPVSALGALTRGKASAYGTGEVDEDL